MYIHLLQIEFTQKYLHYREQSRFQERALNRIDSGLFFFYCLPITLFFPNCFAQMIVSISGFMKRGQVTVIIQIGVVIV